MEKGFLISRMEEYMMGVGKIIKWMDMVHLHGQMVEYMMVT
jgi:hypothetical protein